MKKLFLLLLLVSFSAHADEIAQRIFNFCTTPEDRGGLGGTTSYDTTARVDPSSGVTCISAFCQIDSREGSQTCDIALDNPNIPAGCARARIEKCGTVSTGSGDGSGSGSGSGSGRTVGDSRGGDDRGGDQGRQQGGGTDTRVGGGSDRDGGFYCEDFGGMMYDDHPCYRQCKKTWGFFGLFSKEGTERKECRRCLGIRDPRDGVRVRGFDGNYSAGGSVRVGGGGSVSTGGGSVSTGGGTRVTVGGDGDGNWVHIVNGGITYRVPAHCVDSSGALKASCRGYLTAEYRVGGGSSRCEYGSDARGCIGDDDYTRIVTRHSTGVDCVNCQAGSRSGQHWLSGVAEIVGAIAPPLAQFGAAYYVSKHGMQAQQAWAGAAQVGFEQCRLGHQDYMNYLQNNELPGMTPEQRAQLGCNGFQLGGFAGLGGQFGNGYGGFGNALIGGGYSPGFLGGMIGPYGGYNPYGIGGLVGGVVGGGYPVGGGLVGGVQLVGGAIGGTIAGYGVGGAIGGYPIGGGYGIGGAIGGVGAIGGAIGGYGVGGAIGGYPVGGYGVGGAIGGYPVGGGYGVGGAVGGWGGAGGWGGQGGWGSGTVPWGGQGGYWGATGGWGQQNYMAAQQASVTGANFQDQALARQFGMAGQNYQNYAGAGYGYGSAGFAPANLGGTLQIGGGVFF